MEEKEKKKLKYKKYGKDSKTRVNMNFTNEFADKLKNVCNKLEVTVSGYVESNLKRKLNKDDRTLRANEDK